MCNRTGGSTCEIRSGRAVLDTCSLAAPRSAAHGSNSRTWQIQLESPTKQTKSMFKMPAILNIRTLKKYLAKNFDGSGHFLLADLLIFLFLGGRLTHMESKANNCKVSENQTIWFTAKCNKGFSRGRSSTYLCLNNIAHDVQRSLLKFPEWNKKARQLNQIPWALAKAGFHDWSTLTRSP